MKTSGIAKISLEMLSPEPQPCSSSVLPGEHRDPVWLPPHWVSEYRSQELYRDAHIYRDLQRSIYIYRDLQLRSTEQPSFRDTTKLEELETCETLANDFKTGQVFFL